jgi:nicotinamide mononucleotide adenylyltransferase
MFTEFDVEVKLAQLREMQNDAQWERIVNQAYRERPAHHNPWMNQVLAGLGHDMIRLGSYLQERYNDCTQTALESSRQEPAR